MKRYLFFLLIIAILSSCQEQKKQTTSTVLVESAPESALFSAVRLARIDTTLNTWVQKGWINGAVGLIARNGKIIYYKAAGYNNLETKEPLK